MVLKVLLLPGGSIRRNLLYLFVLYFPNTSCPLFLDSQQNPWTLWHPRSSHNNPSVCLHGLRKLTPHSPRRRSRMDHQLGPWNATWMTRCTPGSARSSWWSMKQRLAGCCAWCVEENCRRFTWTTSRAMCWTPTPTPWSTAPRRSTASCRPGLRLMVRTDGTTLYALKNKMCSY